MARTNRGHDQEEEEQGEEREVVLRRRVLEKKKHACSVCLGSEVGVFSYFDRTVEFVINHCGYLNQQLQPRVKEKDKSGGVITYN